jgi:WD40 repeat protein
VQFSPDGSKLASASSDKKVMVWNPSTGAHLHTLDGHSGGVNAVQFSPDGSKLASASSDKKVMVWNPSTGAHLHTLEGHSDWVGTVQFSQDGSKLASASGDSKVMVWDASTGAHLHTLEGHSRDVIAVQFSPDGSKLASASGDRKVMVWDLNTNSPIQTIDVKGYVRDLAFSTDGFYLKTNIGSFKLEFGVGTSHDDNTRIFHLQVGDDWILRHEHRTIWLPPELRGRAHTMSVLGVMVLGCASGSISFWEIDG